MNKENAKLANFAHPALHLSSLYSMSDLCGSGGHVRNKKPRPDCYFGRGKSELIFARQHDDVIGKIEADFTQGKIGIVDPFSKHDATVSVIAFKGRGLVKLTLIFCYSLFSLTSRQY